MRQSYFKIFLLIGLLLTALSGYSQTSPQDIKTALVYKIAGNIKWEADTASFFTIGLLCDDEILEARFKELAQVAEINGKPIHLVWFENVKLIQPVHLLYVEQSYNGAFHDIQTKVGKNQTLIVSEQYNQPGEIMVNLRTDATQQHITFEYNRANILFHGLELSDKIVLLKGSEIEIRQLYLQAKKLWDEQQAEVELLKAQTQNQQDSVWQLKQRIETNELKLQKQIELLRQKDSISDVLSSNIITQKSLADSVRSQLYQIVLELKSQQENIAIYKQTITHQKAISDSLSNDIGLKTLELDNRSKAIGEKESVIHKQSFLLIVLTLVAIVILISTILIFRAYWSNKKARQKIADQKKELENILEKLQEAQRQLVQSEKMASLGVLSAGIAHEINNPLNFINGGILALESYFQDHLPDHTPKVSHLIHAINEGVKRSADIVASLSHYSRRDDLPRTECDIHAAIDNCLLMLQNQLKHKVEIKKHYSDKACVLLANEGQLYQALLNIIANAGQAIENEGVISISTEVKPTHIIIKIADTGCGISEEHLEKIFDPFFTTKDPGQGTGLGLSITYKIVQEHNGTLHYRSKIGKGTTATLDFKVNNQP